MRRATSSLAWRAGRPSRDQLAHRSERPARRAARRRARCRGDHDRRPRRARVTPRAATSAALPRTTSSCSFVSSRAERDSVRRARPRASAASVAASASRRLEHDAREPARRAPRRGSARARRGARHPAEERVALGGEAARDERGLDRARAGQHDDLGSPPRAPRARAARPGSAISGMPASETSTTDSPAAARATRRAAHVRLAALVAHHELGRGDVERGQQRARAARVLAGDHVAPRAAPRRTQRDVAEVADRRGTTVSTGCEP